MSVIGGLTGQNFINNVKAASADGISPQEFKALQSEYNALNPLAKYSVASKMAGEFPELGQALRRGGGFQAFEDAGGRVQR